MAPLSQQSPLAGSFEQPAVLAVLATGAGLVIGGFGNVLVVHWHAAINKPALEVLRGAYEAFADQWPGGFVLIVRVGPEVSAPDAGQRQAIAEIMDTRLERVLVHVSILDHTGIMGAAARAVMTAIMLVTRGTAMTQPFQYVSDAADWIVARHGSRLAGRMTSAQLAGALRQLEATRA